MEKRYQVFVSSTYADLQEERQQVIRTLMEMDCIPAGMELFPAADEETFEFIKKVVDDCDYYLLIIGGRYGSITTEGISYTEKEYDYAVAKGIKIIALIHGKPEDIPVSKSEVEPLLRQKLEAFKNKVGQGRLVRYWHSSSELPGLVALNINKAIKMYPAVGWVRANTVSNTELLSEINELRKEKERLESELTHFKDLSNYEIPDLASGEQTFEVYGTYKVKGRLNSDTVTWSKVLSWNRLFYYLGPHLLLEPLSDTAVSYRLAKSIIDPIDKKQNSFEINNNVLQTIKIQLIVLGLVQVQEFETPAGIVKPLWQLTKKGMSLLVSLRTIKSSSLIFS